MLLNNARNLSVSCGERETERWHTCLKWHEGTIFNSLTEVMSVFCCDYIKSTHFDNPYWVTEIKIFSCQRITCLVVWKFLSDFGSNICPKWSNADSVFLSFISVHVRKFQDNTSNFDTMYSFLYSVIIL